MYFSLLWWYWQLVLVNYNNSSLCVKYFVFRIILITENDFNLVLATKNYTVTMIK